MARKSPYLVSLTEDEAAILRLMAGKYSLPYFQVIRARMILMAVDGLSNQEIADRLDTRREVVSRWRKRFLEKRLAGLEDAARSGRPCRYRVTNKLPGRLIIPRARENGASLSIPAGGCVVVPKLTPALQKAEHDGQVAIEKA